MSKRMKITIAAAAAVLAVLMVATTVMMSVMLVNQQNVNHVISVYTGQIEDVAQEDDVTIGQHYVIKSTTQISDAYKSGDTSQLDDRDKETLAMAKDVIKDIIKDGMSDFEKEEAVYKFLTKGMKATTGILTVISDTSADNDNPHDVLKNRSAVCVGYATTFRMFMQMFGIECKVVHSNTLGHSWDLVKLDDGCWYHTDCYMDNESSNYKNFNMSDTTASQCGHEWNREFFPAANGRKYNYILMNSKTIKNINAIPKAVMEEIKNKSTAFGFTFKEPIKPEDEPAAKYMVEQLDNMMGGTDKFYFSSQWTNNDEGAYVLCYYITYSDETVKLDEKIKEKVDKKINDVLDEYKFYETFGN